jgi:high-affinity iron transporter
MFEALVITLREGVEAALVLAIASSLLKRRGLARMNGALGAGAALAVVASAAVAALAARINWNEDLAEGLAMLVGAVLVLSLTWWMWKSGPNMRHEVESGIERVTASGGGRFGVALFAFIMVFREGVETAIFLSAAGFNSQGLGQWIGAAIGLALAIVFGVMFMRGALRIPLKPFFSLTSAILLLIGLQLLAGGLHELSEAQWLPSSRAEMALVGPLVRNEMLLWMLTIALAAGWLLFGPAEAPAKHSAAEGPEARLERASRASDRSRRRWAGALGGIVVTLLAIAFVQRAKVPDRPPAARVALESGELRLDATALGDGHAHFFEVALDDSATAGSLRFFAIRVNGEVRTCLDACQICGPKGYFESGGALVCRNCTSPIAIPTLGRGGGCNPIPVPDRLDRAAIVVRASDLEAARNRLPRH